MPDNIPVRLNPNLSEPSLTNLNDAPLTDQLPDGLVKQDILLDHGITTAKQMTRRITHDFNNLISVVQGYSTVLQGRPQLDSECKELVSLIEQAGSQLAGLTDRLARFADTPTEERTRLNLNRLVEDFVDQYRSEMPENIELRVELEPDLPDLFGDRGRLQELCKNIWTNAIESMARGGILSCQTNSLRMPDPTKTHQGGAGRCHYVRLRVCDTGGGMDAQCRSNLFAPFFSTKSGKGRGLGATTVYEIVKSQGGMVGVSSSPGGGTQLDLYFLAVNEPVDQPEPKQGSTDPGIGPTLLVVDDDDMVRMAIQRMLTHLGYRSMAAARGEEALAIYEQSGPEIDAVILDITMPGVGGVATFHALREIDSEVKIIISSGDTLNPAIRELEALGISFMIAKPFQTEQLARAIQQTLM